MDKRDNPSTSPPYLHVKEVVDSYISVSDSYVDENGVPCFIVERGGVKDNFKLLARELAQENLVPLLRHVDGHNLLKVYSRPLVKKRRGININLILLFITLGTIFVAGYYLFISTPILAEILMSGENFFVQALIFTICLFGIIGVHEFGHILACRSHGMDFSLPYFIPGPPPFGTFGAVVSLRSPPRNRDELFDTGFAGPIAGFLATILVTIVSLKLGFMVTFEQALAWEKENLVTMASWPSYPLLFDILTPLIRPIPAGYSLILTQIEFAAWVGALVTFLNILPIWQLDGGHLSRAMFGARGHKFASIIGLVILMIAGYWFFAILILFWMFGSRRGFAGAEPLDDVSPLSPSRRILYLTALVILVLCFVMIRI